MEKGVNGKSPPGREVLARAKALGQGCRECHHHSRKGQSGWSHKRQEEAGDGGGQVLMGERGGECGWLQPWVLGLPHELEGVCL